MGSDALSQGYTNLQSLMKRLIIGVMLLLCKLHQMHNLMKQLLSVLGGMAGGVQSNALVEDPSCNMIWSLFPVSLVVVGTCKYAVAGCRGWSVETEKRACVTRQLQNGCATV